jgi:Fur family ferric uptake transcriptional regulator
LTQKRSTWQKTAVKEQLDAFQGFVSAQELHQEILAVGKKLGLTTVYRALTELVRSGEADALNAEDGETKYRNCTPKHHHHLICRKCGRTEEFELAGFEAETEQIASSHGFSDVSHSIELFGICGECGVAG